MRRYLWLAAAALAVVLYVQARRRCRGKTIRLVYDDAWIEGYPVEVEP